MSPRPPATPSRSFPALVRQERGAGDDTLTLTAIGIAGAIGIFATYQWGKLTDRIGRRPVYLLGALIMAVFAAPMLLLVTTFGSAERAAATRTRRGDAGRRLAPSSAADLR